MTAAIIAATVFALWVDWLIIRSVARWKRPARCENCGLRPRWAFDFTPRGADELYRDHLKVCL